MNYNYSKATQLHLVKYQINPSWIVESAIRLDLALKEIKNYSCLISTNKTHKTLNSILNAKKLAELIQKSTKLNFSLRDSMKMEISRAIYLKKISIKSSKFFNDMKL